MTLVGSVSANLELNRLTMSPELTLSGYYKMQHTVYFPRFNKGVPNVSLVLMIPGLNLMSRGE